MTNALLQDPDNAKAYQTLCDNPRGSTRAWADKAGWTHSKMVRFLDALKRAGIAEITKLSRGSLFRTVPKRSETFRPADLGSKSESDKVPRYGDSPAGTEQPAPIADAPEARIIAMLNSALSNRWNISISYDHRGSIAAAQKILRAVPVDRAVALIWEAGMAFTPDKTGGDLPRSLGHPFFVKYVINEYRRAQRDLERGQLSMVFVERVEHRPVYGARKETSSSPTPELPRAQPETIDNVAQDWRAIANSPTPPRRA